MLNELKLLHLHLKGLIEEAEAGRLSIEHLHVNKTERTAYVELQFTRKASPTGCDHGFRRIGSGEYECKLCGVITDDLENEQWQS